MLEKIGDIVITDEYWDCECEAGYIQPAFLAHCEKCGAEQEYMPSSHLNEVLAMKLPVKDMQYRGEGTQKQER